LLRWKRNTGVLPCADCPGIEVTLQLKDDNTYALEQRYQERDASFSHEGKWQLKDNILMLEGAGDTPEKYLVEDGHLVMLDMEGKKIEGALSQNYILKKR
jgi:copper homeostasis protein (lipoprotein)